MTNTDRMIITLMMLCILVSFILIDGKVGRLEEGVRALEQKQLIGEKVDIDVSMFMSHFSEPGVDDRTRISNGSTAYIGRGPGEYHIVSGTPGDTGRSCIDIPTGDWTPTRGKAIGIRISDMPYNVHISDPMRN